MAALRAHDEKLDQEQREFGPDYQDHGVLFCWQDGRPPYLDKITRRFKKLAAAAAGLPDVDLDDVRHSYPTAGRDAKIDWIAELDPRAPEPKYLRVPEEENSHAPWV
jgi:hypothetical protein